MDSKWILQNGEWFKAVKTKEELKELLAEKKESRMQRRMVWAGDYDYDIWQLEVMVLLKSGMTLYGVMDDYYNRKDYAWLDKTYGSCPRKRNKITFHMPLTLSIL